MLLLRAMSGSVIPPKTMRMSLVGVAAWSHVGGFSDPSLPLSGHAVEGEMLLSPSPLLSVVGWRAGPTPSLDSTEELVLGS